MKRRTFLGVAVVATLAGNTPFAATARRPSETLVGSRELLVPHPDLADDIEISPVGLEDEEFPIGTVSSTRRSRC